MFHDRLFVFLSDTFKLLSIFQNQMSIALMKTLLSIPPSIMPLGHTPSCRSDTASETPQAVNLFATVVKKSKDKQSKVPSMPPPADDYTDWGQDKFEEPPHCCQAYEYDSNEEVNSVESSGDNEEIVQGNHTHNITTVADACTVKVVQLKSSQNLGPTAAEDNGASQLASDYSKCPVSQLRSMCSQRGIRLSRNAKKVQMLQALREHDNSSP